MQAKDFKIPFTFENRVPALLDRFFFIPDFFSCHSDHSLLFDHEKVFTKQNPLAIEYCSGNGAWVTKKAVENPNINWIAVERRFDRARKIWLKIKNSGIENLFLIFGEAFSFTHYYLRDGIVDGIYINFPDPWPKKRHAKKRLVNGEFVGELARISKSGGELIIATDDSDSVARMQETISSHVNWHVFFDHPGYAEEWPDYGASYFDSLWRQKGLKIKYLKYLRK